MKMVSVYFLLAIAALTLLIGASAQAKKAVSCNQKYALCNTSACMQIPGMKHKSLCTCSVENGFSASYKSCKKRMEKKDSYGNTTLISSYSFENADDHSQMTCKKGAWASCLDAPCVVDPEDSNKAFCTCSIQKKTPFITQGGECNTSTCSTTLWSGATEKDSKKLIRSLMKATKIDASPVENCKANN